MRLLEAESHWNHEHPPERLLAAGDDGMGTEYELDQYGIAYHVLLRVSRYRVMILTGRVEKIAG